MTRFSVEPIGVVRASRTASFDDDWDAVESRIELDHQALEADATLGLADFSHIEVVYLLHLADEAKACRGARHPRGREDWPRTGILLDVKPYLSGFAPRGEIREPSWSVELMAGYW